MLVDEVSAIVIDEAIAIHRELGPGLFPRETPCAANGTEA
jgi:hypothetical protein